MSHEEQKAPKVVVYFDPTRKVKSDVGAFCVRVNAKSPQLVTRDRLEARRFGENLARIKNAELVVEPEAKGDEDRAPIGDVSPAVNAEANAEANAVAIADPANETSRDGEDRPLALADEVITPVVCEPEDVATSPEQRPNSAERRKRPR